MSIPTFKLDLLLELRKKYVVYLLSNTNEIHWQWSCLHAFRYKAFRAEDFFEHIYLSYEMKMAKPDATKEEMEAVLQKVNLLGFLQTQDGLQTQLLEKASNLSGGPVPETGDC